MRFLRKTLAAAMAIALCAVYGVDRAAAQVVQLPRWEYHAAPATILVPDSGGAALGGIRRGRGQAFRGPGGRGVAAGRHAGSANATAIIHDLDELDRRVLAEAADRRRGKGVAQQPSEALKKSRSIASPTSSAEQPIESLAEIRRAAAMRTAGSANAKPKRRAAAR